MYSCARHVRSGVCIYMCYRCERVFSSMQLTQVCLPLLEMSSTEEKLDNLIKSVAALHAADSRHQQDDGLEKDVTTAQEEVTDKAVKRAKHDSPFEFKRKNHKEQFCFNQDVGECISSVMKQIDKLNPTSDKDKTAIDKALADLDDGSGMIAQRQKFIRIAD